MNPTHYQHFIDDADVRGEDRIERHSPGHDGRLVSTFASGTKADAERAIAAARKAFDDGPWPHASGAERQAVLTKTAAFLRRDAEELAMIETLESGKPISQARNEIEWAAGIWDYAAALCRHLHGETTNSLGTGTLGLTLREPIGVCGLVTPWNFPLLIVSQKLPFALAAGCTAVVKPSEFTSGTTLRLAKLLQEAGLPGGVCNVVTGYGDPVGQTLAESGEVDMISFTGSTAVGRRVAEAAAGNLKKVALELGGKNPQLLFADCDLDAAVDAVLHGAFFNMGECCNAGSRVLVQGDIADELVKRLAKVAGSVRVGDPLDESTQVGAIINDAQQKRISDAVAEAEREGASVAFRGEAPGTGRFVPLTILDRVTPEMKAASFEIFGPVLSVIRVGDEDEAVRVANATGYGLSASVWTADGDRALRLTRRLRAGTVWINTFLAGAPELPFGGYGQSGLGRELGPHAVEEYTETKTVTIRLGAYQHQWAAPQSI